MKTKLKTLASLLFLATVIVSCSKDDDKPKSFPTEDFMDDYITDSGFSQATTNFIDSGTYEFGLEFTPLVKGKITKLNVKLPATNPALRITIWDLTTTTVFRTEMVNVATADTETIIDITDLELVKDKKYAITMNSNDWYKRSKTDNTAATYPITSGNIRIDGYKWSSGSAQTYPINVSANYYAGDVRFDFQQIE